MGILTNLLQQVIRDVQVINKENLSILTEVHGAPPSMKFSFQIFKDCTISYFKGFTKIKCLINSFTHRAEQYSQVKDIIERLRTPNRNITDELKNTVDNLQTIIESESMNPEEEKKVQFLIEQMIHSQAYAPTLLKTAVSLYQRSLNCYSAMREYLPPSKHCQGLFWHHWYFGWIT